MLNDLDRALVEHDAALPALESLLDTQQMERLVAERIGPEKEFSLSGGYLRYKAGVSCLARYQVSTPEGAAWAYAKAFAQDAAAKYEKLKSLDTRPGVLGPGRLFFDDQKLVFSTFPNDSRLRVLARLEDAESGTDTYQKIFKGMDGWNEPEYRVLSYKPERRLAARFSNANGDHLLVKFYDSDEFIQIRKYRKRLSTPAELPIQKWIGGSKSHNALVFGWLKGQCLAQVTGPARTDGLHWAGQALAQWHLSDQPGLRKRSRSKVIGNLKSLARGVEAFHPQRVSQARGLAAAAGRWWRTQARQRIPLHGDFDATQVIIGEDSASLIDGDEAHLGNAVGDLACFRARAEYQAMLEPYTAIDPESEQEILMRGYRQIRPGINLDEYPKYVAWHLLHLLHTPFRSRHESWPEITDQLLARCHAWWEK